MSSVRNCAQAARAIALQNGARNLDRQSGRQSRVARNAARVFATLVGAADDDVLDLLGFELTAGHYRVDRAGEKVVGTHLGEGSGIAAERGALSIEYVRVEHGNSFQ